MTPLLPLLLLACAASSLPDGTVVDGDFLVPASEVTAPLNAPCRDLQGTTGPYVVSIDDRTGFTLLLDTASGDLWVRDPFGTVSDRCWWLPRAGADPAFPHQECAPDGRQHGACAADADAPDRWRYLSPGVSVPPSLASDLAAVDGTALLPSDGGLLRFDVGETADPPVDPDEDPSTRLDWLAPLALPDGWTDVRIAAAEQAVVLYEPHRGRIGFYKRTAARRSLEDHVAERSAPADGIVAAYGDAAVVASAGRVDVWTDLDGDPKRHRRDHRALRAGVRAAAVDPDTGWAYAIVENGVVALSDDGAVGFWPITGAEGLFVGRPGYADAVYAWGNDDAGGVVWRLGADGTATAAHTGPRLLGAGVGAVFQEIVLVEDGDAPTVRGVIDRSHLAAIPDGAVRVALAAFIESPKDPDLLDPQAAITELSSIGGCPTTPPTGSESEYLVCCAQGERGRLAETQLDWLDTRLRGDHPLAVVLGVNPSSLHVSALCDATADPAMMAMADRLPTTVADHLAAWEGRGVASAAVFLHGSPYEPTSWWVGCPDLWPDSSPPSTCWDTPHDEDTFARFFRQLAFDAALGRWGPEPDWRLIAGGYGAEVPSVISWTDVIGKLDLPDGQPPEDGLFFGNLGMDPRAPGTIDKEMAPDDARQRPFPIAIDTPGDRWDGGGDPTGDVYWPGQTFSLEYLYELRQSGLLFQEYVQVASLGTDWSTPRYRGDERADAFTHADFALAEEYLTARVLAHRDTSAGRFWTIHLGDLSRIRLNGLGDGWIACADPQCTTTELDRFADRLAALPSIAWRPTP